MRIIAAAFLLFLLPSTAFAQSVVGVLGIAREIDPIEKRLQDVREVTVKGYVFRVGTLNGRQVVVGRSGVGKVSDNAKRIELRDSLGATAVEMEGAAVVQTCRQFGLPCLVVRSITDRADGQAMSNYEQFLSTASENAAALVAAVVAGLK